MSTVAIPAKAKGNPGANVPEVALDVSGFQGKNSVIGPDGAAGGSIKKQSRAPAFFAGGESEEEKQAIMNPKKAAPAPATES